MFEPRIYKKNGLEAFRLVGSDGSEFFYEGAIDCDEKELYKDAVGRMYYRVSSRVGGPVKYYVELDPQVPRIPLAAEGKKEKDTSRLVNTSPRDDASLPDDIYIVPEIHRADTPAETAPDNVPVSIFEKMHKKGPEPPAAKPLPAPEEKPVMKPEASEALHAMFAPKVKTPGADAPKVDLPESEASKAHIPEADIPEADSPKVDILHPSMEKPGKKTDETREKMPVGKKAAPPAGGKKKRSLKWPAAIAVVIVLLAVSVAGVYVVRPDAFNGLRSLYAHPTATPQPTPEPTAEPAPAPTPAPTAVPGQTMFEEISRLIEPDSAVVLAFAQAHTNASTNDTITQVSDLFTYVNGRWNYSDNYTGPRKASEIAGTLEGTQKDYTVLMHSLLQSIHIESRVVFSNNVNLWRYYPEVLAANTTEGYDAAVQALNARYGAASPQGHKDDTGNWIALSMGDKPGIRPGNATDEYALYNGMIGPIKAGE